MSYHHGDLRSALLAASFELLAEGGLAKFSVAAVARRLGVSSAAPYRHFPDRAHLLSAVSAVAARDLRAAILADPAGGLLAVAGAYVRSVVRTGAGFPVIFAAELYAVPDDERREHTRALISTLLELAPGPTHTEAFRQVEATIAVAQGYVTLYCEGFFDSRSVPVDDLVARAVEAARALTQPGRTPQGTA
ncbi:TetR family transcriptional regulator [Paractinoplanes abujensis]|uniref:AcrR family transcriptional regulator n=1 Tax=Paractinoplanes abujensis TaxID=882441 RepID=A0A7W7G1M9_9ACTN|nr:TetR/AcrR family transcriptional regulator [Actinoplanes abujensis]MBB4692305.1 AcrR family transcriptional regulator [Actinoplanes abujensis]GID24217.1 TetR family transcriptional regulator [Actinoplanes abujensis]